MPIDHITPLSRQHRAHVAELLIACFREDPAYRYIFRTPGQRARWTRRYFTAIAKYLLRHGRAYGVFAESPEKLVAVCAWLDGGISPPPWYRTITIAIHLLPMIIEPSLHWRAEWVQRFHRKLAEDATECIYLGALGVCERHRGVGVGSALVKHGLDLAARAQRSVFVECWTERRSFYERFGFSQLAEGELVGIPDTLHGLAWTPPGSCQGSPSTVLS